MNGQHHPFLKRLASLDLPNDHIVIGSACMLIHGLRDEIHDVDIIAGTQTWMKLCTLGQPHVTDTGVGEVITLFDGEIEAFTQWSPGDWDLTDLLSRSERVNNINFASLMDVLHSKELRLKHYHQEKHQHDIKVLKAFLKDNAVRNSATTVSWHEVDPTGIEPVTLRM